MSPLPDSFKTAKDAEKAVLVHTIFKSMSDSWEEKYLIEELQELTSSTGTAVIGNVVCHRDRPSPATLIGKGKLEEIVETAKMLGANVVIIGADLSPTQQRNVEDVLKIKTIDRTQLILDIFASRAQSLEGKLQIELAQLGYLMPRLLGQGILASRLGGGIGTRGPGEQMLEKDRRHIRRRISHLKEELNKVKLRRESGRKRRIKNEIPSLALVGYTSAGKSTLFNALTGARQSTSQDLFRTLDPLSRTVELPPSGQKVLIVDTVGFLHRLPHHLVEAFKATLEEVVEAEYLLHVVDASHPMAIQQIESVTEVLKELGTGEQQMIHVINKCDLIEEEAIIHRITRNLDNTAVVSALKGTGIQDLLDSITTLLNARVQHLELLLEHSEMALINRIYKEGRVLQKSYADGKILMEVIVPGALGEFIRSKTQGDVRTIT